jgi:hypothetical protein
MRCCTHALEFLVSLDAGLRRGKLYVYGETMLDKGTGNKQWNEKGKGDVKILRSTPQLSSSLTLTLGWFAGIEIIREFEF